MPIKVKFPDDDKHSTLSSENNTGFLNPCAEPFKPFVTGSDISHACVQSSQEQIPFTVASKPNPRATPFTPRAGTLKTVPRSLNPTAATFEPPGCLATSSSALNVLAPECHPASGSDDVAAPSSPAEASDAVTGDSDPCVGRSDPYIPYNRDIIVKDDVIDGMEDRTGSLPPSPLCLNEEENDGGPTYDDFHHINFFGSPLLYKSPVPAATCLAVIKSLPAKGFVVGDAFDVSPRIHLLLRKALHLLDPVIFHGSPTSFFGLRGSAMEKAAIGNCQKIFRPLGWWQQDLWSAAEGIPFTDGGIDDGVYPPTVAVFNGSSASGMGSFCKRNGQLGPSVESVFARAQKAFDREYGAWASAGRFREKMRRGLDRKSHLSTAVTAALEDNESEQLVEVARSEDSSSIPSSPEPESAQSTSPVSEEASSITSSETSVIEHAEVDTTKAVIDLDVKRLVNRRTIKCVRPARPAPAAIKDLLAFVTSIDLSAIYRYRIPLPFTTTRRRLLPDPEPRFTIKVAAADRRFCPLLVRSPRSVFPGSLSATAQYRPKALTNSSIDEPESDSAASHQPDAPSTSPTHEVLPAASYLATPSPPSPPTVSPAASPASPAAAPPPTKPKGARKRAARVLVRAAKGARGLARTACKGIRTLVRREQNVIPP